MSRMVLAAMLLAIPAAAQQVQKGIGMTGTMYDGNNTARSAIGKPPDPHPTPATGASPAATTNKDESGTGAGGGEH
jgi:hypothetical protein